jgi:hypothetical protein
MCCQNEFERSLPREYTLWKSCQNTKLGIPIGEIYFVVRSTRSIWFNTRISYVVVNGKRHKVWLKGHESKFPLGNKEKVKSTKPVKKVVFKKAKVNVVKKGLGQG